ncbi:MAG: hypothetical protein AAF399_20670, partial [Bacteroidota bacterium]
EKRSKELENIAPPENWRIKIVFVAYNFAIPEPQPLNIHGYRIEIEFKTFGELYSEIDILKTLFIDFFLRPINENRTPHFVREKLLEMISS